METNGFVWDMDQAVLNAKYTLALFTYINPQIFFFKLNQCAADFPPNATQSWYRVYGTGYEMAPEQSYNVNTKQILQVHTVFCVSSFISYWSELEEKSIK